MRALVVAFLVLVAAGMAGLALYFGFLPGLGSRSGTAARDALPDDSTLAASVSQPSAVQVPSAAPATDSAAVVATSETFVAATAVDSAAGDAVYHGVGRCVGCHGVNGEGAAPLGSSLRTPPRLGDGSIASIVQVIARGAPPTPQYRIAMPSYAGQLSSDDMAHVAAYVYSLSHPSAAAADSAAVTPPAPAVRPPDPAAGAVNADAPVRHPTVPAPPAATTPARRP